MIFTISDIIAVMSLSFARRFPVARFWGIQFNRFSEILDPPLYTSFATGIILFSHMKAVVYYYDCHFCRPVCRNRQPVKRVPVTTVA